MPDLPSRMSDLITTLESIDGVLTANPANYGIDAPAALDFHNALVALQAAESDAADKAALSAAATQLFNTLLDDIETSFRAIAAQAVANPELADEDLALINVFRRADPAPKLAPDVAPVVTVERLNVGSAIVWLQQEGGSRSKPDTAVGCEISLVDATAAAVEGEANSGQKQFVSRCRATVNTSIGAPKIRLYARWMTARGLYSPWSLAVAITPQT